MVLKDVNQLSFVLMGDSAHSIIFIFLDIQKPIMCYKIRANKTPPLHLTCWASQINSVASGKSGFYTEGWVLSACHGVGFISEWTRALYK